MGMIENLVRDLPAGLKKSPSQDVVLMIQRRWRGVLTRRRLLGTVWAGVSVDSLG